MEPPELAWEKLVLVLERREPALEPPEQHLEPELPEPTARLELLLAVLLAVLLV